MSALADFMYYMPCTVSDTEYLAFTKLRTTNDVVKKDLPPADDAISTDIDIPSGLAFGNSSQTTVYVSSY